jgi:hyperosmotically inducible periplasmic protein
MKKPIVQTLIACGVALSVLGPVHAAEQGRQSTMGQYVDDATITTKVKAKHAEDKAVSALRVSVETKQGVVVLSGEAKTEAEIERAEVLAKQVEGVKAVSNMIELKPKS